MIISLKKVKRLLIIAAVILIPFICINILSLSTNKSEPVNKVSEEQEIFDKAVKSNVQSNEVNSISFFSEYRMERERVRGKQLDLLREISNNSATDKKVREVSNLKIVEVSELLENEMQAETMIKSKGYKDCAVLIENSNVTAIVECNQLEDKQEEEIRNLLAVITKYGKNNISVTTRKHYR